jgi:nodulation protein E
MPRVAITGLGCISALGTGVAEFWQSLAAGRCGIRTLPHLPIGPLQIRIGADVAGYDANLHFDPKRLGMLDRYSQFALIAAREAIADSGLDFQNARNGAGRRTAVILGTGIGGETTLDEAFYELYAKGNPRVHPGVIPRMMASAATSHLTMEYGITGPAFTVTSACSSASHAIGQALSMLRQGAVDAVITGGSESCFTLGTMKAWEAMRVMAPDTCRPFSRGRRGMVLGEGAGVLVLETFERARERGAVIHGELAGVGMSADAGHLIQPSESGAVDAIRAALRDAEVNATEIDYINAHGTGTTVNDVTEARAVLRIFGSQPPPVSSTKSMHGHALGASGALELIATVLAVRHGVIPPTVNFVEHDPECDVDCVPNTAREKPLRAALSNSFAFGGLNAVLAVRRAEP